MNKKFELKGVEISYEHKINRRTRRLRLVVYPGAKIVITTPPSVSEKFIIDFVNKKSDWILKKIDKLKNLPIHDPLKSKQDYLRLKVSALALAKQRIEYYNQFYNYRYNKVSIKNHKSLWGSCSKRGNLNFNYRIATLPPEHADYVIVHELCHLKEFNHSQNFWKLVAQTVPNYKTIRKNMKHAGLNVS